MWYPRTDGTIKGIEVYPGANSAWTMGWVDKNIYYPAIHSTISGVTCTAPSREVAEPILNLLQLL